MKWPVVLIGVILVSAVLIFMLSYGTPNPVSNTPTDSTSSISILPDVKSVAYTDTEHGFSIMRPETASTSATGFEGFLSSDDPLVGIYLPQDIFKSTNLVEAGVFIGEASTRDAVSACMKAADGEESKGSKRIGNVSYQVFTSTGAAAGNIYQEKKYRTVRNGDCFEIVEMMHSGNIGNYPPGSVTQFDADALEAILESMVSTFTFISKTGSGVEGKLQVSCGDTANEQDCAVSNRTIEAYQGVSPVALFKSSSDGSFNAELPPGQYELRVDVASTTHCASVGIVVTESNYISTNIACQAGV